MRHFAIQRLARLTLYATLARCALACGADSDHGPPIGAPTGPVIVDEGGNSNGNGPGNGGQPGNPNGGAAANGASGTFNTAANGGTGQFEVGGNGNGGGNPFGVGGSSTGDPFGSAGLNTTPSGFSGSSAF